jgi:hypothetical protein
MCLRSIPILLSSLCALWLGSGPVQAEETLWPTQEPGPHAAGLLTVDVVDYGRVVAPRVDWQGHFTPGDNFRRVRVSVWYPAVVDGERMPMRYRDYIESVGFETHLEGELLFGVDAYVAHSTFGSASEEKLRQMVELPTTAYRDAVPLDGVHPAIVSAPSDSYEPCETWG